MEQPKIAGKAPQMVKLETGKTYAWCACGKSESQPWCNGVHEGSDFSPNVFTAEKSKRVALCLCKQTGNPPYCDGAHAAL